ncbi:MAG: hypothetical protein LJE85_11225 [Gammaproteobacteria bacterium]|jgi:hypothetical protein|nr:hypothetical protein [Gammaproteobacteria bacterium]
MRLYQLALFTTVIAGVMVSCALPPPVPDAVVTEKYSGAADDDLVRKVTIEYADAKIEGLEYFAPDQFAQGKFALSKATRLRKSKADEMEVLKQLYIAEKQLNICRQVKSEAQKQLPEVLAGMQKLSEQAVEQSYPSEFDSLRYNTSRLLRDIEDVVLGKPAKANNKLNAEKAELMKEIRDLEIQVVKFNTLNESKVVFKEVESLGGKRLAPETYQQAKQALQAANDAIEKNVNDKKAIEQAGKDYEFAVFHALHVARAVAKLESLSRSDYEAYILDMENKLHVTVQAFGYRDIRNHSLHEQIQVLSGLAQRLIMKNEHLSQARNAAMPEEIQQLGKLKEEHDAAQQKIQELSSQVARLQSNPSSDDAAVSEAELQKLRQKAVLLEQQVSELLLQNNDLKTQRDSLQNKLNAKLGQK